MLKHSFIKLILVIASGLSIAGCAPSGLTGDGTLSLMPGEAGIINGEEISSESQDPLVGSLVRLLMLKPEKPDVSREIKGTCTGTLIARDVILTAAHCVKSLKSASSAASARSGIEAVDPDLFIVSFDQEITRYAVKILLHPDYARENMTTRNDIGLIQLDSDFYSDPRKFKKVRLDSKGVATEGSRLIAYGYGTSGYEGGFLGFFQSAIVGILNRKTFQIIPSSRTNPHIYRFKDSIFVHHTSDQKAGSICFGDSGGPGFVMVKGEPILVGVNSYVPASGGCKQEAALMSVSYHHEWIQKTLIEWRKQISRK